MKSASSIPYLLALRAALLLTFLLSATAQAYYPMSPSERPEFYGDATVMGLSYETTTVTKLVGGKATFIFYFSATCPHCQDAGPHVAAMKHKYSKDIQFLGIASAGSRLADIREYMKEFGVDFPIYQDSGGTFGSRNELHSYPSFLLTDGKTTQPPTFRSFGASMVPILEIAIRKFTGQDPFTELAEDKYYGALVCSACHIEEYKSWGVTLHAASMNSLVKKEKHEDPKCLSCHVVGFGKPTGYTTDDVDPALANVGCEVCHGMAGGHSKSGRSSGKRKSKRSAEDKYTPICITCHDKDHSIAFGFSKGAAVVSHVSDRRLNEADWVARRSKLLSGEVERPLLEFPAGKIMGAKSCAKCHSEVHKGWQSGPHSTSMKILKEKGNEGDPSCVRCHATLLDRKKAEDVAAYTREGVECESCHGSGEAHMAAGGGAGNIVALSKACPTCIVENLCTSCHTEKWSPSFSLEKALEVVRSSHKAPGN